MKEFFRELNDCAASMFTINRQGVAILIFLPIIYTLLFAGLFYENSLTKIPVIICNLDDGSTGRSLVEDFLNTPELKVIAVEGDALDDEKFLREDTAFGVIVIPKDFSNKLARGENIFRNPARCLGAKIFLYTLFESAVMAICLAIGIKFFGMICRGNPSEILILVAAYVACVTAFGLMMGAVAGEPHQSITWSLFYVMPSVLFAGAIWPRTSMDNVSLLLSYIMPIGYAANDLRNFLVKGTAAGVEGHIAALLLMGAIFFAAAVGVLKFKGAKNFAGDNAQGIQPANT